MAFGFSKKERRKAAQRKADTNPFYRARKRAKIKSKAITVISKEEIKPSGNGMVRKEK